MDKYMIQSQSGIRIDVNKGQRIEIIDVEGGQVADFFYQNGADHPNCLDNINHDLGIERTIIQSINFFMNTVIRPDGKIESSTFLQIF